LSTNDACTEPPEYEYVPNGWDNHDSRITGWNVESVLETQKAKWPEFLRLVRGAQPLGIAHEACTPETTDYSAHNTLMAFAYVLALTARKKDRVSLLDWGGGIGHYYVIGKALLPAVEINYHCKDVPAMVRGGRELLPEAVFYDDDNDCFNRTYDLVMASSSLQYCRDWRKAVRRLASVSDSYLYITRLPLVCEAPSFVVVQRPHRYGYETEYLSWFLRRDEFLNYMNDLGTELIREFLIHEKSVVHGAPEQGEYRGFLFRPQVDYLKNE